MPHVVRFILSEILLILVLPLAALSRLTPDPSSASASLLAFIPLIYGATRISMALLRRPPSFVPSVFGIYVYINYGLAALLQSYSHRYFWAGSYSPADIRIANLVTIIGCVGFEIGYLFMMARRNSARTGTGGRSLSASRTMQIAIFSVPLLVALFFLTGSHHTIFLPRSQRGEFASELIFTSSLGLLSFSLLKAVPLVLAIAFGALLVRHSRPKPGRRGRSPLPPFLLAGFITFSLVALVLANPISTPRLWQGTVASSFMILGAHYLRWNPDRLFPPLFAAAYLIIFPMADYFRYGFSADEFESFSAFGFVDASVRNLISGDFDSLQQTMNTLYYVESQGVDHGHQLIGAMLFFVPRVLWPEKPLATGVLVADYCGYEFNSLSSPLWAEGLVAFGYAGVILLLLVYGLGLGYLDRLRRHSPDCATIASLFLILFSGYQIFFIRGALINSIAYFAPVPLMLLFMRGRRIRGESPSVQAMIGLKRKSP